MKYVSDTPEGWLEKEFSTEKEADAYLAAFYSEHVNTLLNEAVHSIADEDYLCESVAHGLLDEQITRTCTVDNTRGTNKKKSIGLKMKGAATPAETWKIFVRIDETLEAGNRWDDDISFFKLAVVQCMWYWVWWNGNSWQLKESAINSAPAGTYWPRVGISWQPK